jgi:hypothetical protein
MLLNRKKLTAVLPSLLLTTVTMGSIVVSAVTYGDDAPPSSAPDGGPSGRHHNPAWAACRKQADDQKLEPGDARHAFMKNCLKAAKDAAPAAPAS